MAAVNHPAAPCVAVGVVVLHDDHVLLVRRGNAPSKGVWAVPGGSVELGEPLRHAAEREVLEETGVRVRAGDVVHAFDAIEHDGDGRVAYHYVVVDLLADYLEGTPRAAGDALEAQWVAVGTLARLDVSAETRRLVARLVKPRRSTSGL